MLRTFLISIAIISGIVSLGASARQKVNLNLGWEFHRGDSVWQRVDLPHDFQVTQPWVEPDAGERASSSDGAANVKSRLSARGFKEMGKGWYRYNFTMPDSLKGKRILLDFEGVMLTGDAWLNGQPIGGTDYGYLGFDADVSKLLRYDGDNEIVVVADTGEPTNSRWYTGGGLYRDVNMIVTAPDLYFNRHGLYVTTPEIGDGRAVVRLTGDINAGKPNKDFIADVVITAPDGSQVASVTDTVTVNGRWRNREYRLPDIVVENPQLWDCDDPALYTAAVTLRRNDGSVADDLAVPFGIRTIEYSPDFGLKLNGRKVLLKGIANHHTLGALGAAAYPRAMEKRIQLLKEFGFNHIRTAHNPYSEEFLNLCDRYGILVVDELYDKWLRQFAGGRKEWTDQWQHDVSEWIRRDRNHPSVIMWSLGNELQGYNSLPFNDWGVTAYKLQKTLLDRYDTTRPVTVAMHPRYRSIEGDSIPAPLVEATDIASYNYRYMYFPDDGKRYPWMIFYQSEANMSGMGPNFYEPDNDKVVGLAYWGMIDYLGESRGWPEKGWTDGVFDISLEPKANAYFLKAMFTDEPVVHIGVVRPKKAIEWNGVTMGSEIVRDHWNLADGDTVKIYTYTNADEVSLRVNGREIGRKRNVKENPSARSRIVWDSIPYRKGKVEAVAYSGGREVARHSIATAGKPVKLVLTPDNDDWRADGIDLQHVRVHAVDASGRRCPQAADDVRFTVEGDASIVAVSNGDMTSDEMNTGSSRRLHEGSALVILRAGTSPSEVKLKASAPSFRDASVVLVQH